MAEQLICNQQVDGSTPFTSSIGSAYLADSIYGGIPERPKGADCKSVVTDFGGPNPPSPTNKKPLQSQWFFVWCEDDGEAADARTGIPFPSPFPTAVLAPETSEARIGCGHESTIPHQQKPLQSQWFFE